MNYIIPKANFVLLSKYLKSDIFSYCFDMPITIIAV